jgi:hypothetical protein
LPNPASPTLYEGWGEVEIHAERHKNFLTPLEMMVPALVQVAFEVAIGATK